MTNVKHLQESWFQATADLPWGVQRVLHDTLNLVAEGKVTLVHSKDYSNGSPCLINAVGQMLTSGGGNGIPTQYFGQLVGLFDRINQHFQSVPGYNDEGYYVSPNTAEILLHWFAPLKNQPLSDAVNEATQMEAFANHIYVEPSDADLMRDWLNALEREGVTETSLARVDEHGNV